MSVLNIRWNKYIPHKPTPKQIAFLALPHDEALFGGAAGGGKLLAEDGVILTPFGFKKNVDLRVGDLVNNPDGSICRIIQLKDWETLPKWRVHFHDGTYTDVCEQHLWLAWRSGKKAKRSNQTTFGVASAEIVTTEELRDWVRTAKRQEKAGKRANHVLIPICKPQSFNVSYRFPSSFDPYFLGVLLGDGCITGSSGLTVSSSTFDYEEHWSTFFKDSEDFIWEIKKDQPTSGAIRIRGETRAQWHRQLKVLKLLGTNSHTKFIPRQFLLGSLESRTAILQGLMDTDGYIDERGQLYFCSVSPQLRKDVCFLVRSLGGIATEFDDNEIYLKLPKEITPFRMQRKISRLKNDDHRSLAKRVVNVEVIGTIRGRCLSVSHPNGLYITNDFIVTHNSDCLLMAGLQYADLPNYRGIIFRRSFTDLLLPNSILDRAKNWLAPFLATREVRYDKSQHTFYFNKGGTLAFGYIDNADTKLRYQSAEFHYIGFDELTHFFEDEYLYMHSRLRRTVTDMIPLRVRAGTNPGGRGGPWVKKRWAIDRDDDGEFRGHEPTRPFIQSKVRDNPHISEDEYTQKLNKLTPTERDQLRDGDWSAAPDARFKKAWFDNRYTLHGDRLLLTDATNVYPVHQEELSKFITLDVAGSEREGAEGQVLSADKKAQPCWSVCSVWGLHGEDLVWLDNHRSQTTIPEFIKTVLRVCKYYRPMFVICESNSINIGVIQGLRQRGVRVIDRFSSTDKVVRSIPAQLKAEKGTIWLPKTASWLFDLENELFFWTGRKGEVADQIDTLSLASAYASEYAAGYDVDPLISGLTTPTQPPSTSGLELPSYAGGLFQGSRTGGRGLRNLIGVRGAY